MATRRKPKEGMRDSLKFRLAAKYAKGKRVAQKRQPSKGHRSYRSDDD